jgi:hypothetical protein
MEKLVNDSRGRRDSKTIAARAARRASDPFSLREKVRMRAID